MQSNLISNTKKANLVVLASGNGSNLQAIINACQNNQLFARVAAVFSDNPNCYALERAKLSGIPTFQHIWSSYKKQFLTRNDYDKDLAVKVREHSPDIVILAGWMRILTKEFLNFFPQQVINLHPALPGCFPGIHAIERAWDAYCAGKITHTGVMVHYVLDEDVDNGPVLLEEIVPILGTDDLDILKTRIHLVEHKLLISALHLLIKEDSTTVQKL